MNARCAGRVRQPLLVVVIAAGLMSLPGRAALQPVVEPFDVAELFLELNDTDGDLGLHASLDGGGWASLEVTGPKGKLLLEILASGPLRRQALTQLALESTEPQFDELDPERFFQRFPEGEYAIEGRGESGDRYRSVVYLSHVLAAPVEPLVSGLPAAPNCDADPLPVVGAPVLIDWDPVISSHPSIGRAGPVEITRYQFFVEQGAMKLSLDLPPTTTEFMIPLALTAPGGVFKFEIIARTSTGNNTAVESCFEVQ